MDDQQAGRFRRRIGGGGVVHLPCYLFVECAERFGVCRVAHFVEQCETVSKCSEGHAVEHVAGAVPSHEVGQHLLAGEQPWRQHGDAILDHCVVEPVGA